MTLAASARELEALRALERFAQELHEFLDSLPHHVSKGRLEELRARCNSLRARVPKPLSDERLHAGVAAIRERLSDMQAALSRNSPRSALLARHEDLARAYEHWISNLRASARRVGVQAPERIASLKPLMGARTIFHMSMGVVATVMYQWVLTQGQAMAVLLTLFGIFASLEISRRFSKRWNHFLLNNRLFHPIARPHEYWAVNSSTYYLLALCIVTPLFPKNAVLMGVLILAFADPAAAWVGKKWGRLKLHGNKSLLGSLSFVTVGAVCALLYAVFLGELTVGRAVAAALVAAVVAGIAELYSGRLDDNLTVPIFAVLGAYVMIG